jgi:hypothetical protein
MKQTMHMTDATNTKEYNKPHQLPSPWGPPQQHGKGGMNNFSSGAVGINLNEAPQVNKDYTSLFVLMLHFTGIIHLLVGLTDIVTGT